MSSSKAIIACYLETISNLTGASSVNLCLTETGDIKNSPRVYQSNHSLLAEFDHQEPQQLISHLNALQLKNNQIKAKAPALLTVTRGATTNTRLIHFNMSLELGLKTSLSETTNAPIDRRETDYLNTYFDYSLWLGLDFPESPPSWLKPGSVNDDNSETSKESLIKCLLQLGGLLTQHLENTTKL